MTTSMVRKKNKTKRPQTQTSHPKWRTPEIWLGNAEEEEVRIVVDVIQIEDVDGNNYLQETNLIMTLVLCQCEVQNDLGQCCLASGHFYHNRFINFFLSVFLLSCI